MSNKKGFTLIELMVVILIVAILASVAIPVMRGRIESAKWSEAAGAAGAIRTAVKAAYVEKPTETTGYVSSTLADGEVSSGLKFQPGDLEGTYFTAGDYTISAIDTYGNATITVSPSKSDAPSGQGQLDSTGWNVDESYSGS